MSDHPENQADSTAQPAGEAQGPRKPSVVGRLVFAVITLLCFAYLYYRIDGAAGRGGLTVATYMSNVFAAVDWVTWVLVMAAYSLFYFLINTLVVSRALS